MGLLDIDVVGLVALSVRNSFLLYVGALLLLSRVLARVCVSMCSVFLVTFDSLHKVTAWLEGRCLSEQENVTISKRLGTPRI